MCATSNETNVVITQITKLPIIHINIHIILTKTRDKDSRLNNNFILHKTHMGSYKHKNEPSSYVAQQPIIYDYKIVMNNYLSLQSTDTTFGGRPNLRLVG